MPPDYSGGPEEMKNHDSQSLSALQIREALLPFKINASDDQVWKIREYTALLLRWNRSVSLTSVTAPIDVVTRHFGESMVASKLLPVEKCRLVDIGTGAGFPGLALKISCPGLKLDLVESNNKKCAFLAEVVRALGLSEVDIHAKRYEDIRPRDIFADIVTCRAVGDFKGILRWSSAGLARRGHLVLWVGAEDSTKIMRTTGWIWQTPQRLPESQRRFLLVGHPTSGYHELQ
jgi:16S rRNA (guanine527-N7)-methyltransferase